jgi:hypothetical protein
MQHAASDSASLTAKFLIANDNPVRIVILSDQRESKGLSRRTPRNARPPKILIANLELEFESSLRKQSPLRISNRKYFAIFDASAPKHHRISNRNSRITENQSSSSKQRTKQISNRNTNVISQNYRSRLARHPAALAQAYNQNQRLTQKCPN